MERFRWHPRLRHAGMHKTCRDRCSRRADAGGRGGGGDGRDAATPGPNGCPTNKSLKTAPIADLAPPARTQIEAFDVLSGPINEGTQTFTMKVRVGSTCSGIDVKGASVYVTAVPYNQFTIPDEGSPGTTAPRRLSSVATRTSRPATSSSSSTLFSARTHAKDLSIRAVPRDESPVSVGAASVRAASEARGTFRSFALRVFGSRLRDLCVEVSLLGGRECPGCREACLDLSEPYRDQSFDERLGQWPIDRKMQRALGPRVARQLVGQLRENRAAERQVAQVASKRSEPGNRLTAYTEGRNTIGDDLLSIRNDLQNRAAKRLERGALGLLDTEQVLVDLLGGHSCGVYADDRGQIARRASRSRFAITRRTTSELTSGVTACRLVSHG